jgi:hypothetical protein
MALPFAGGLRAGKASLADRPAVPPMVPAVIAGPIPYRRHTLRSLMPRLFGRSTVLRPARGNSLLSLAVAGCRHRLLRRIACRSAAMSAPTTRRLTGLNFCRGSRLRDFDRRLIASERGLLGSGFTAGLGSHRS